MKMLCDGSMQVPLPGIWKVTGLPPAVPIHSPAKLTVPTGSSSWVM